MAHRRSASAVIYRNDARLTDFFTQVEIEDFVQMARRRVIGAFHHATEDHRGRKKGTDNYILGVEPKQSELAKYVLRWIKQPFIKPGQMPEDVDYLSKHARNQLIYGLQFEAIMTALRIMCVQPPKTPPSFVLEESTSEIHYDSIRCVWQIRQSSIDEYVSYRRAVRNAVKQDDRSYHGRNRGQSKRRGIPEGTSIGCIA